MFSSRCSTEEVPGMGSMIAALEQPSQRNLHGSALACFRDPIEILARHLACPEPIPWNEAIPFRSQLISTDRATSNRVLIFFSARSVHGV